LFHIVVNVSDYLAEQNVSGGFPNDGQRLQNRHAAAKQRP